MPTPNANDKTINELDPARAGAPDSDFEIPVWDKILGKTVKRENGLAGLLSSSSIRGGVKFVAYTSSAYLGVLATDSTLDRVNPATLVVGNEALVYNPSTTPTSTSQRSRGYVLARVAVGTAGAVLAYIDDNTATTTRVPCVWVEKNTAAGDAASVEPFDPDRDVYNNGANVKLVVGGALGIFAARKKLRAVDFPPTNKIPAPTGAATDANWTAAPASVTHTQNTDTGTTHRVFQVGQGDNLTNEPGSDTRTVLAFGGADGDAPAALAYNFGAPGGPGFEACYDYTGQPGDVWQPLADGDIKPPRHDSYQVTTAGAQAIPLVAATFVYSVSLRGVNGTQDPLSPYTGWSFANSQVQILASSNVSANAVVEILHNGTGIGTGQPPANNAPTVMLSSPQASQTLAPGDMVVLNATPQDADGAADIKRVEFLENGVKFTEATVSPYTVQRATSATGARSFTARVYDMLGASGLSNAIGVTVTAPTTPALPINLLWDGNSGLDSYNVGGGDVPNRAAALLTQRGYNIVSRNFAVGGQTTANMLSDAATQVYPLINEPGYSMTILVNSEGSNHIALAGASLGVAFSALAKYNADARSLGAKTITTNLLNRTGYLNNGLTPQGFANIQSGFNQLIGKCYPAFCDELIDVHAIPITQADGTHPDDYSLIVIAYADAIERVINGTTPPLPVPISPIKYAAFAGDGGSIHIPTANTLKSFAFYFRANPAAMADVGNGAPQGLFVADVNLSTGQARLINTNVAAEWPGGAYTNGNNNNGIGSLNNFGSGNWISCYIEGFMDNGSLYLIGSPISFPNGGYQSITSDMGGLLFMYEKLWSPTEVAGFTSGPPPMDFVRCYDFAQLNGNSVPDIMGGPAATLGTPAPTIF